MFDKDLNAPLHCLKSVRIRSYSGPYFPVFGLNTERCWYVQFKHTAEDLIQNLFHYGIFHLVVRKNIARTNGIITSFWCFYW